MVATDPSGYSSVLAVSSGSPVAAANTATGSWSSHHEMVSTKWHPSPTRREPSSGWPYQLPASSRPALTS